MSFSNTLTLPIATAGFRYCPVCAKELTSYRYRRGSVGRIAKEDQPTRHAVLREIHCVDHGRETYSVLFVPKAHHVAGSMALTEVRLSYNLTWRDLFALRLLSSGLSSKEIAYCAQVTYPTMHKRLSDIYSERKLGLTLRNIDRYQTRVMAVLWYLQWQKALEQVEALLWIIDQKPDWIRADADFSS